MSTMTHGKRALVAYFVVVGALLFAAVAGVHGLGPLDDHHMIRTLFRGEPFGVYVIPELGRFFPLTAQEYVLLGRLFAPSPTLFYAVNAAKLPLCGVVLAVCLFRAGAGPILSAILWTIVLCANGMANTLYRLSAGELNELLLMLAFVWSSGTLAEGERVRPQRVTAAIGLLVFATSLFYKELAFVFGLAFAGSEMLRGLVNPSGRRMPHRFLVAVMAIGVAYVAGYALWRMSVASGSYANFHDASLADVLSLFALNDPFLICLILPLTAFRAIRILGDRSRYALHDSYLLGASAYVCAYLVLRLYSPYYLLPAYAFGAIGFARLVAAHTSRASARIAALASALCLLFTLPVFAADVQAQKNIANNHYAFVQSLAHWISGPEGRTVDRRRVLLAGVSPGNGVEIIQSLETFLTAFGADPHAIDVVGTEATDNDRVSAFFKMRTTQANVAGLHDLLVFNPYTEVTVRPPLRSPSYRPIVRSPVEWTLPRWDAADWFTYCFSKRAICGSNYLAWRRYAGYSAFEVARIIEPVEPRPLTAFDYRIKAAALPNRMHPGESTVLPLAIVNQGRETWPATGKIEEGAYVNLAYRWFDEQGRIALEGNRVALPEPMRQGDLAELELPIAAPNVPGRYRLAIGPVQETVAWFPAREERWIDVGS